ncbi:type II toxin-antitoxin system MqsA family antitoxin [Kangiella sp.]|uniref:type II toxin-antitoxin system MqsA family antitoxin n=1 Tax=Kangiella sp. TaxID=1920245 RepID=UPI003A8F0CFA
MNHCTNCESSNIQIINEQVPFSYKSKTVELVLHSTVCRDCGDEYVSADQIKEADNLYRQARADIDGILKPEEIREIRKCFGYTQEEASQIFGGGSRAFGKYERGEVNVSTSMNSLMLVARDVPGAMDYLVERAGMKPKVELKQLKAQMAELLSVHKPRNKHLDFVIRKPISWISEVSANDDSDPLTELSV